MVGFRYSWMRSLAYVFTDPRGEAFLDLAVIRTGVSIGGLIIERNLGLRDHERNKFTLNRERNKTVL